MKIRKGMPGLKQTDKVASDRLASHLDKYGYIHWEHTSTLWYHKSRPVTFTLCVDDFGIKYVDRNDVDHLLNVLQDLYSIICDWKGELYLGLTLKCDYMHRKLKLSMPDYIPNVLLFFKHSIPTRKQHSTYAWSKPKYGATQKFVTSDDSKKVSLYGILRVQQIINSLLYYALAVDCTLLIALGYIVFA